MEPSMDNPAILSLTQIAERCRSETQRRGDERFCFELLRRALVERQEAAWSLVLAQYENLVRSWSLQHPYFVESELELDESVSRSFLAWWQNVRGDRFGHDFGTVGALLAYLKQCVHTTIATERRAQERRRRLAAKAAAAARADVTPRTSLPEETQERLWRTVLAVARTAQEQVLVELMYRNDLPPREVTRQRPDLFADVADVYRTRRNLLDRLRRSPELAVLREELPE